MITIILKFWREVAIALLLIAVIGLAQNNALKNDRIHFLKVSNENLNENLNESNAKLDTINKALLLADKNRIEADKKRAEIIAVMTKEINTLRLQTPPKECSVAVEWAIDNKSDLSWKK